MGAVRDLLVARGGAWAEALGQERALRMAFNHVMCEPGRMWPRVGKWRFSAGDGRLTPSFARLNPVVPAEAGTQVRSAAGCDEPYQ